MVNKIESFTKIEVKGICLLLFKEVDMKLQFTTRLVSDDLLLQNPCCSLTVMSKKVCDISLAIILSKTLNIVLSIATGR